MVNIKDNIQILNQPRPTVEVHLPDGIILEGPRGTAVEFFLRKLPVWNKVPVVGSIVNGELRELTYKIDMDSSATPVSMSDADGVLIYRRSLTFLLEKAFEDLYSNDELVVDHAISSGGFYCHVIGWNTVPATIIHELEAHMRRLVSDNQPFVRERVPLEKAIQYFSEKGYLDKVRLLKYRTKDYLILYQLGEHKDYHHGYMVPSTGYLKWFKLSKMGKGFILRFPRRNMPTKILPMPGSLRLLETFTQYGDWLTRLEIDSVGALNDAIAGNRIQEVILVSEALHEQKIADIAKDIVTRTPKKRIVLIAGPSCSGKTTFSKRLAIQLLAQGISPIPIEMDNYFVDRENTPLDENGQYNFETIDAVNIPLLGKNLLDLIQGKEVQIPHYNFKTGKSEPGDVLKLNQDQLIILEGIHGLNPGLLPVVPAGATFRLYVSLLTRLNLDHQNRISTTDSRLIRRIVRDARERGYNALQTISRWASVRFGEKNYIFPYQENADVMFNSALAYELSSLKLHAEPLLRQVPHGTPEYIEAKRLLTLLEWFLPTDVELIPDNSILREFLGKSNLKDFKLWKKN